MDWQRDSAGWPNRDHSRFVSAGGIRWHVQEILPEGAPRGNVLLLHGSGATTHSFADLLTCFGESCHTVAVDLPGHGFSSQFSPRSPNLDRVCEALEALLADIKFEPDLIVGHSAGAAIAVRMAVRERVKPKALVSINGAFYPFPGFAAHIFPAAARLLFLNPFTPWLFSFGAGNRRRVEDLIRSTGSKLTPAQVARYQRALMSSDHIEGTLALMAHWDLTPMADYLGRLSIPVLQVIGGQDGTISPSASEKTARLLKCSDRHVFTNAGHLVHEELPTEVFSIIEGFAEKQGVLR